MENKSGAVISVVVPIFCVQEYLEKCVFSIQSQSYEILEVLLVDDGSPDGCPQIPDEYALSDSRVITVHKPNGGLSDARNAGMRVMSGEYVMFVDSDDALPENALLHLKEKLENSHAQLAIGDNRRFERDSELEELKQNSDQKQDLILNSEEAMKDFFNHGCAAWARLYRREIHEGIFFPVGEINEDEAVVLKILDRCERVVKTSEVVYHYRCRPESITTNDFHEKKMIFYRHCCENEAWIRGNHSELIPHAMRRRRGSILTLAWMVALSDKKYESLLTPLIRDLRERYKEYQSLPIGGRDRLFCFVLKVFPFSVYRLLLRIGLRLKGHHFESV